MQELSQYNFQMEYLPWKEGRKPEALTRRAGDLPTVGEKRLPRNVGSLLLKEHYQEMPDAEEMILDLFETTEFQDKDEGEIQKASKMDKEINDMKGNYDKAEQKLKGIALGLCQ